MKTCKNCKHYKKDERIGIKVCEFDLFHESYCEKDKEDFAIEEIEKIWEKIRALPDINPDYPMDKTIHISRYEVQKIIYERIAELKGNKE